MEVKRSILNLCERERPIKRGNFDIAKFNAAIIEHPHPIVTG